MRKLLTGLIKLYQYAISPMLGSHCRFIPSCSNYAVMAIEKRGVFRGVCLIITRLLRCHAWHKGGHDPVP